MIVCSRRSGASAPQGLKRASSGRSAGPVCLSTVVDGFEGLTSMLPSRGDG